MIFKEFNIKMITIGDVFELISFKVLLQKLMKICKILLIKKLNKFKNKNIYSSVKIKEKLISFSKY